MVDGPHHARHSGCLALQGPVLPSQPLLSRNEPWDGQKRKGKGPEKGEENRRGRKQETDGHSNGVGGICQRHSQDSHQECMPGGWQHEEPRSPLDLQGQGRVCPERVGVEGLLLRSYQGSVLSATDAHPIVPPPSDLLMPGTQSAQGAAGANSTGQVGRVQSWAEGAIQCREDWEKAVGSRRGRGRWNAGRIKRERLERKKRRGVRSLRGGSSFAQPLLEAWGPCQGPNPQISKYQNSPPFQADMEAQPLQRGRAAASPPPTPASAHVSGGRMDLC